MQGRARSLILNGVVIGWCLGSIALTGSGVARVGKGAPLPVTVAAVLVLLAAQAAAWSSRPTWAWILMLIGGVLALPIGVLAILAALSERRRLRSDRDTRVAELTCRHCGYPMTGLPLPQCPECGCAFGFDKTFRELGVMPDELRRPECRRVDRTGEARAGEKQPS